MWQELRSELHPLGLEVVTVALDVDPQAPLRWIERAQPQHPSLIDQLHLMDELFGVVNVPSGIWIDEQGMIVRPPETAFPPVPPRPAATGAPPQPVQLSERMQATMAEARKLRVDREKYVAALRDWVQHGASSRYVLSPEQVLERSQPRGVEEATAAAHFELAQALHAQGRMEAAVPHFREAHRLQPDNWTYRRQAWVLVDPEQGPSAQFDGDWLSDVRKIGAENYYPPLQMD